MAFEVVPVLDPFTTNGALSASWTTVVNSLVVTTKKLKAGTNAAENAAVWGTQFSSDQEAWAELGVLPTSQLRLFVRWQDETHYYAVEVGPTAFAIHLRNGGSSSTLSFSGTTPTVKDIFGITVIGKKLTMWRQPKGEGAFVELGTVEDSTIATFGSVGIEMEDTTARLGSFGGGSLGGEEPKTPSTGPGYPTSALDRFPLRLLINGEDTTFELDDGFTFSNTNPGGYEAASFPLPKDRPDLQRGDPVVLTSGLRTVWEGRIKEVQRSLGQKTLIQCEGYRGLLVDNSIREIFVDRDLTKWQGPTLARQIERLAIALSPAGPELAFDPVNGNPALVESFTGTWEANSRPSIWATYDAQGITLGALYYAWTKGININAADAEYTWKAAMIDIGQTVASETANLRGAGPGAAYLGIGALTTLTIAELILQYNGVGPGAPNVEYAIYWSQLAVYGRSFNQYGAAGSIEEIEAIASRVAGGDPTGYYPSQIVRYVRSQCPGLVEGIIETASQYVVPHAAYLTAVSAEQVISDMAKFAGWHWGVWESLSIFSPGPRLDFRALPQPGNPTAWAWRNECDEVDVRENLENLYTTANVSYTEPGGTEMVASVSIANKALEEAGITGRTTNLSLGTGTKVAAEKWGVIQLELLLDQARQTGTASIKGSIHNADGYGSPLAPWMLKAGIDRLRIIDLPSVDAFGEHNDLPISRVECSGGSDGLTTSIEFGKGVNLIETFAAQLGADITAQRQ
jgi:hypothetical protein